MRRNVARKADAVEALVAYCITATRIGVVVVQEAVLVDAIRQWPVFRYAAILVMVVDKTPIALAARSSTVTVSIVAALSGIGTRNPVSIHWSSSDSVLRSALPVEVLQVAQTL